MRYAIRCAARLPRLQHPLPHSRFRPPDRSGVENLWTASFGRWFSAAAGPGYDISDINNVSDVNVETPDATFFTDFGPADPARAMAPEGCELVTPSTSQVNDVNDTSPRYARSEGIMGMMRMIRGTIPTIPMIPIIPQTYRTAPKNPQMHAGHPSVLTSLTSLTSQRHARAFSTCSSTHGYVRRIPSSVVMCARQPVV